MRSTAAVFLVFSLAASPILGLILNESHGKIIGGGKAVVGEFPWQSAIYLEGISQRLFCGGVIVSHRFTLTAAHCAEGANDFSIQLGSNRLQGADPNRVYLNTATIFVNDRYDQNTLDNDLALIEFHLPVTLTAYIQPIPLETTESKVPPGSVVTITGWGQVSDSVAGIVNELQKVDLVALTAQECQVFFSSPINDETQVCAAGNNVEGICFGDTGSGLITRDSRGIPTLVGIASFFGGSGCETTAPSGFARTFPHVQWITDTIRNNNGAL